MPPLIGLLPAAGRGVRAYPHTATVPKSMLDVDGVPNLQRNVEMLRDQLGVRDVRIVVGHHGEAIVTSRTAVVKVAITYVDNPRVDLELPFSVYQAGRDRSAVRHAVGGRMLRRLQPRRAADRRGSDRRGRARPDRRRVRQADPQELRTVVARRPDRGPDREAQPSHRPHDGRRHLPVAARDLPPSEAAYAGGDEAGPRD